MNNKHLTFEERSIIEDLLNKGEKIHKIAQKLGKPDSSIPTAYSLCCHCDKCMELCNLYEPEQCPKLGVVPYVCNGCGKIGYCNYDRYTYMATYAQNTHDEVLVSSREGNKYGT